MKAAPAPAANPKASRPRPVSKFRPRTRAKRCYELAFRFLQDDPSWTLVHGRVAAHIGHAWLEQGDWVYDPVRDETFTWQEYVERSGAVRGRSFSLLEAAREVCADGTYGPWGADFDSVATTRSARK